MGQNRMVVWFSCGAASAVAAKLAVQKYGGACHVLYCDVFSAEHPDNQRFFNEVQVWIGTPITIIRSTQYASIDDVFQRTRYMAGIAGARCTTEMKKIPRVAWQRPTDTHIFGYTVGEEKRAQSFEDHNPELNVEWLLIDQGVKKQDCHTLLAQAGIRPPRDVRPRLRPQQLPGLREEHKPRLLEPHP